MKRLIVLITSFMMFSGIAMAINYPVVSWVSTNKNMLKINTDGSITINFVASASKSSVLIGYPSVTVGYSATTPYLIKISSDGCVGLSTK